MSTEQEALMMRLQQLGLTAVDLNEYLDTHLYDSFAMQRFMTTADEYAAAAAQYCELYGPLTAGCNMESGEGWPWAMQSFPWDY